MPVTASASVRAMIMKSASRARVAGGADLLRHGARGDHALAGEMAAALGEFLVLELDRVGAGALQHLDRAGGVDRVAEAGIGIDDERQGDGFAHGGDVLGELGEGQQPDIGRAQEAVGDARAGDIGGGKAQLLDDARRDRVRRTRHQDRCALVETGAECFVLVAHG